MHKMSRAVTYFPNRNKDTNKTQDTAHKQIHIGAPSIFIHASLCLTTSPACVHPRSPQAVRIHDSHYNHNNHIQLAALVEHPNSKSSLNMDSDSQQARVVLCVSACGMQNQRWPLSSRRPGRVTGSKSFESVHDGQLYFRGERIGFHTTRHERRWCEC